MESKVIKSLTEFDKNRLRVPGVVVYFDPADYPGRYAARVWEIIGNMPMAEVIVRDSYGEIREDILAAGYKVRFPRYPEEDEVIVETWI